MSNRFSADTGNHVDVQRLRRFWWALAVLCFSVIIDLMVTMAQQGGKPGKAVLALSIAFAGLSVFVIASALLLNESRLMQVRGWFQPFRYVLVLGFLTALFLVGMVMQSQFVYAHAGLTLALTVLLALITLDLNATWPRGWTAGMIAVVLVAVCLRVYALSTSPDIDIIDEPWNLSWSATYLQTGYVSEFTMVGQPGDPTYYTTAYVPRWAIPVAWWMQLVGIGLWQGRLFSLLVALLITLLTALASRNLYGRMAALFTAAAMFCSAVMVIGLRLRHDIGVGLAIALSLWLYSEALKRERTWLHLAAGLAMGWGGFAHYHAFGLGPAIGIALYLPRYVSAWRRARAMQPDVDRGGISQARSAVKKWLWPEAGAWFYALGLVLGLGSVALIQIAPDVQTFLVNRAPRNPTTILEYFRYFMSFIGELTQISWYEAVLIGFGLVAALWRRRVVDISLVLAVVLAHFTVPILTYVVKDHYLVPLTPFYGLLIGAMLGTTLSGPKPSNRLIALVASLCLLMPLFGQTLKTPVRDVIARKPVITPTPALDQWVIDHVPTRYIVMGENADYLWLHDYHYYALWLLDFIPPGLIESFPSREDFLLSLKPDVILFNPAISTYGVLKPMLDDPAYLPAHGYQRVAEFGSALVYARDGVVTP